MKGDFSRFNFDPRKHYAGVLHQQGRVWLDSDWNEEVLERLALLQQELTDVIGPSGTPAPGSGFQLTPSINPIAPDDFGISAGHCYVNGNLCQLDEATTYLTQPDLLDPPRITMPTGSATLTCLIYLEVWQRLITYLEDDSIREIALGGPDTSTRLKNIVQIKVLPLSDSGNVTCSQAAQLLPGPGAGTLTTLQPTNVQPQNLCQLPDPANFTGRENHLYRVQVHDAGDVSGANVGGAFSVPLSANVAKGATALKVTPALTAVQSGAAARGGFVTVSDKTGTSERVPLSGVSADGFTLTLSQPLSNAYTTANSALVTGGLARFKWSRDNAAFAVSITNVQPDRQTVTLASLGRDVATALRQGDLVEITDDASELGPARGHLTFLASDPDPDKFTAVLADPIPASFQLPGAISSPPSASSNRHMVLRRWDGAGDAFFTYDDTNTPGMNLGDGVHIQFGGQDLRAGDYWQFTARVVDGSVQALLKAPTSGITRFRAPLAVVSWGPPPPTSPPSSPPPGTVVMTVLSNCLPMFPALINFPPVDQGIHIVALNTVDANQTPSPLFNDSNVIINSFAGINIFCDANLDPASISRPTCFVTVEFPVNFSAGVQNDAYFPIVLAGSVSCSGNVISWTAGPQAQTVLIRFVQQALNERGLLAHLTLRGDFIWAQNNPMLFLDGEVFGAPPAGNTSNVSLRLPSGDRRRGGDFEMWFWFVEAPPVIVAIDANPPGPLTVKDTTVITMTLSAPALPNTVITLTFNNSNISAPGEVVVTSPPTSPPSFTLNVPVPVGNSQVAVIATANSQGTTLITASCGQQNGQPVKKVLVLTVQPAPVLTGLTINPPSVFVGNSSTGQITISGPAPSKGLAVALAVAPSNVAGLSTNNVTIPAGDTQATFTITGNAAGTATVTATAPNSPSANNTITVVQQKGKDIKDKDKEHKDKDKEKEHKETSKELEKAIERKFAEKVNAPGFGAGALSTLPIPLAAHVADVQNRAFIRPEERPAVGSKVLNPPPEPKLETNSTAPFADLTAIGQTADGDRVLAEEKQKLLEKPLTAEKGLLAENLGDRRTQ